VSLCWSIVVHLYWIKFKNFRKVLCTKDDFRCREVTDDCNVLLLYVCFELHCLFASCELLFNTGSDLFPKVLTLAGPDLAGERPGAQPDLIVGRCCFNSVSTVDWYVNPHMPERGCINPLPVSQITFLLLRTGWIAFGCLFLRMKRIVSYHLLPCLFCPIFHRL